MVQDYSEETISMEAINKLSPIGAMTRGPVFFSKLESNSLNPIMEEPVD